MITRFLVLFLCYSLFFSFLGNTQGVITGKLRDSVGKQSLSLATVTVFKANDTSIITYRLSDHSGDFKVPGLPLNLLCRVIISFSGYRVYRKEFELTREKPAFDLGTIQMVNDPASLDEVMVYAERPPVSIKKDTIEFNASAFKTLPTALVEDLLKKLHGVEVDKEGNITVNGRKANRILVDGKDFFGGDPKVASRNLPADIIDKVQVTDDKEQQNRDPDIPKADLGQVINLKLKRNIKKGMFGKFAAGAGTDDRYEASGILNTFRDTFQLSLLGFSNNLNKAGFTPGDVQTMGGFQRSGISSMMMMSDGGFEFNGISFGGTGQGIQKSGGAGLNANHEFNKNLTLNLQYFYGNTNSRLGQVSNTEQFFKDTSITTRNTTSQVSDDINHRIGAKLRWKIDSLSEITYTPTFTLVKQKTTRDFYSESSGSYQSKLNESSNIQNMEAANNGYSHDIYYNKNFKKKGRILNITNSLNTNASENDQFNNAENIFYDSGTAYSSLHQLRNRDQRTFRTNISLNYSEPVSKSLTLRISNNADYFNDKDQLATYNRSPASDKYDSLNETLTNGFRRSGFRNNASAGIRWRIKKWTFGPSINFQMIDIDNKFAKNDPIHQYFFYILPSLSVQWNNLNFNYRSNAQEPNVNDLQPVLDNTNPLYLQLGNPSLQPGISHNLSVGFNKYNTGNNTNYNVYINGNISDNTVIRERTVNEQGVQISMPINVDGIWRFYGTVNVRKQFKFINNWQLSLGTGIYGNYGRNVVIVNKLRSGAVLWNVNPSVNWAFNWKDIFEFNQRYSIGYNKSIYENPVYPGLEVIRHNASSEVVVRLPKHWVWESSFDYNYNPQIAPGIRKSSFRWNAAVNFLFLKGDKGQFKLSVYDVLNQNISVYRTVRENYIQDNQTTILQRYFLLTFTYNIRNFAGGKVGGRKSMFMF
jgi:hypothetical protein